jgi:hypothetical protein
MRPVRHEGIVPDTNARPAGERSDVRASRRTKAVCPTESPHRIVSRSGLAMRSPSARALLEAANDRFCTKTVSAHGASFGRGAFGRRGEGCGVLPLWWFVVLCNNSVNRVEAWGDRSGRCSAPSGAARAPDGAELARSPSLQTLRRGRPRTASRTPAGPSGAGAADDPPCRARFGTQHGRPLEARCGPRWPAVRNHRDGVSTPPLALRTRVRDGPTRHPSRLHPARSGPEPWWGSESGRPPVLSLTRGVCKHLHPPVVNRAEPISGDRTASGGGGGSQRDLSRGGPVRSRRTEDPEHQGGGPRFRPTGVHGSSLSGRTRSVREVSEV